MNNLSIQKKHFSALVNDESFDKLKILMNRPNLFEILAIENTEIRHSEFLSWLLNPKENHNLGSYFLKNFLFELFSRNSGSTVSEFDLEDLNYETIEVRREWRNIDLLILADRFAVVIENKISSKDHSNQLQRYKRIAESEFPKKERIYIYLTPVGDFPTDTLSIFTYRPISYTVVDKVLTKTIELYKDRVENRTFLYLADYQSMIRRSIMKTDEANVLALKVYRAHRHVIDFILENRPDSTNDIYDFFEKRLRERGFIMLSKNKGFAKFLTADLFAAIPKGVSKGWPKGESFAFVFDFYGAKSHALFKCVIPPGPPKLINLLLSCLNKIPDVKQPKAKAWFGYLKKKFAFDKEKILEKDDAEINSIIDKMIDDALPTIKQVESMILGEREKFIEFDNEAT